LQDLFLRYKDECLDIRNNSLEKASDIPESFVTEAKDYLQILANKYEQNEHMYQMITNREKSLEEKTYEIKHYKN